MGIIGIVIAVIAFCFQTGWTYDTAATAIGWGIIAEVYLLAYAIVGIVQASRR